IGNVAKSAKGLLDKVLGGLVPGSGVFRDVVAAIPAWIKDNVLKWITKSIDSGVGGPPVQRALRYARAQAGKPYVWGGVGPGGFDCSGFMSALTNVIKGKPPNRRLFTTFSFTGAANGPVGFRRNLRSGFTVGVTNAGVGHMSGTLGGVNVESRGSAGVVVGPRARGTSNSLYSMRYGLKYDDGGLLQRGLTLAYHGARQPDRVLTDSQWQAIHAAARGGDGPSTVNNFYPRTLDMTVRDLEVLQRKQDARARIGRPRYMPVIAGRPSAPPPVEIPGVGFATARFIAPDGAEWPLTNEALGWFTLADGVSGLDVTPYDLTKDSYPRGGSRLRHRQPAERTIV